MALTEEKKARLRETSNHHWRRCQTLAGWLETTPGDVNKHWSCCLAKTGVSDEADTPKLGEIAESACNGNDTSIMLVKEAYLACLTRLVRRERELLEFKSRKIVDAKTPAPPTLESQIRIMCWAIRTIGDEASAAEAFKAAIERRKGIQQHYYR